MAGKPKIDQRQESEMRTDLEDLVKRHGFDAVRTVWNRYSKALNEKAKLLAERKQVEERLAALDKKLK